MSELQTQLVGSKKFRKALRQAGVDMADLKESHKGAATIVANYGRPRTPKRTGKLAASVRPGSTQTQGIVRAGKASVAYANPIHWGWPERNIEAQPWLSKAAQDSEPEWQRIFRMHLDSIVEELSQNYAGAG